MYLSWEFKFFFVFCFCLEWNCSSKIRAKMTIFVVLHGQARLDKEQKKHESWRIRVCQRISAEHNFPNEKIIRIYLSSGGSHSSRPFD